MEKLSPTACRRAGSASATATTSTCGCWRQPSMCERPMPRPITPTRRRLCEVLMSEVLPALKDADFLEAHVLLRELLQWRRHRADVDDIHARCNPLHGIREHALHIAILIGRIRLVTGPEVEDASMAALPCEARAEYLAPLEP